MIINFLDYLAGGALITVMSYGSFVLIRTGFRWGWEEAARIEELIKERGGF